MAPKKQQISDKEGKLKSLLGFASSLLTRVEKASNDSSIISDIHSQIKSLPLPPSTATSAHADELDAKGTELWNLAARLRRDPNAPKSFANDNGLKSSPEYARLACFVRVFAALMIDSSWQATMRGDRDNQGWHFKETVRLMKVMLKAGKACLVQQEREICVKLMERSAVLTEQLGKAVEPAGADEEDKEIAKRLHAEYFVLRTTLAWKQSRLDIAEHMFSKANIANDTLDPTSGEELADSLFEMGKDLLSGRQFELAARWLERALDVLDGIELEQLSQDASDLRLSIVHSYTKALLGLQTADARSKARDMMRLLETDYSEKMIVSLLKLDIILSEENVDAEQYYSVIHRIVLTVMLTANNIKTLMHHIHRLKNIQPDLAVKALDELLDLRLLKDSDKDEWVQKALVTRIWISTSKDNDKTGLRSLHELFDSIFHALRQPANVSATHAVQTLLWKRIESAFAAGHFETCESWCKLAVHQLLEKCGEINKSKIVRKLILCAIQQHEFNKARELFFQVSDSAKAAPITRYLMYKVSLRIEDMEFAAENLEAICKASSKDATFLYACVMEAQQVGNKKQTAQALQKVLGKYEHGAPPGVHLPALLRSMARLLTGELSAGSTPADQSMEELCKVFEGAIAAACKEGAKNGSATHKNVFNMTELEWFSRSSYNLALKGCAQISPQFLVRLIRACQRLIDILLERQPEADTDRAKLGLRAMFCSWLSACAHIVIARTEDNIEASLQSYLAVRSCGVSFRSRLPVQLMEETVAEPAQEDLKDKHFQLIKFELEAALKLLRWEDMDELFEHMQECWKYDNPKHWETLADLVLVIHANMVEAKADSSHRAKILAVLQKIIDHSYRAKANDTTYLARWIRCLFQIAITFDESIGLQCLDQAHGIAQKRKGSANAYPSVELEWLATTSFNRAVDYYCTSDDNKTKLWAEKSLTLAAALDDGGALLNLLREKYSGLSWD